MEVELFPVQAYKCVTKKEFLSIQSKYENDVTIANEIGTKVITALGLLFFGVILIVGIVELLGRYLKGYNLQRK